MDTAKTVDRYADALVIRTFEQNIVDDFAKYMDRPVINALTNESHPCQLLADIQHVREKKGRLKNLKIGYVGDVWNMAHSWGIVSAIFGWDMMYALPKDYEHLFWPRAKEFIEKTNKKLEVVLR